MHYFQHLVFFCVCVRVFVCGFFLGGGGVFGETGE